MANRLAGGRLHCPDRGETAWLMQRRQRRQRVERRDGSFIKRDGAGKVPSAVDDTMANRDERVGLEIIVDPAEDIGEQTVIGLADFRHVLAVLAHVARVLDELVSELLLDVSGSDVEARHALDRFDREMETIKLI
ncbi:hypothetical protein ADUPG1_004662 [Aduncisulcus paluster]|uniref:Uncharacterized protein n=1 Tax=Aduncisulcus paluster TaxID=2918883 RepID=A0ABQ5K648_9EUKA|nr:hypothetical protein ADUPG1_004662 [Aduncisulcus paluster]